MSIKSVLGVAVILGVTCAQVQAGPKRRHLDPQDEPRSEYNRARDPVLAARRDIQASERLRREIEASEQDDGNPNKGWSFRILTIHHGSASGYSYLHSTPYGMYASKADCEQARAEKVNALESNPNDPTAPVTHPIRERHTMTDAPTIATTTTIGSATTTYSRQGGPIEVLLPQGCVPHAYKERPPLPGSRRAER
jgi:hypothetical protein